MPVRRPAGKRATRSVARRQWIPVFRITFSAAAAKKKMQKSLSRTCRWLLPRPHLCHGRAGRFRCALARVRRPRPLEVCPSSCPEHARLLKYGREESTLGRSTVADPVSGEPGGSDTPGDRPARLRGLQGAGGTGVALPGVLWWISGASRVTKQQRRYVSLPKFSPDSR